MKTKGFTMIELLAVISIISLILMIAVPSILNARNNALTGISREEEINIKEAGKMVGIDLDDNLSDIYNCKSGSWIDELDDNGEQRCKKSNSKWVEVTLTVENLVENDYFNDAKERCSGELTITKVSSGYNVTLNGIKCE